MKNIPATSTSDLRNFNGVKVSNAALAAVRQAMEKDVNAVPLGNLIVKISKLI